MGYYVNVNTVSTGYQVNLSTWQLYEHGRPRHPGERQAE
jgi:hypothetical protein